MQASVVDIRLTNGRRNTNGNNSQVGSKEDLVFALRNNILEATEVAVVA
jgi:hypothetical protein